MLIKFILGRGLHQQATGTEVINQMRLCHSLVFAFPERFARTWLNAQFQAVAVPISAGL